MPPSALTGRMERMEKLRADLLRRARKERRARRENETSEQQPTETEPSSEESGLREEEHARDEEAVTQPRSINLPQRVSRMFGRRNETSPAPDDIEAGPQVPKSPDVEGSVRRTRPFSMANRRQSRMSYVIPVAPTITRVDVDIPAPPHPAALAPPPDLEQGIQDTAADSSTGSASRRTRRRNRHLRTTDPSQHPKKFLLCLPWIPSRRIRTQLVRCLVSGGFIGILLAVYIGLSVTQYISKSELSIMLLLVVLCATVFFALSLVRLCLLLWRGDRGGSSRSHMRAPYGPGGYIVPREPIRVRLAQDDEVTEEASKEAVTAKPPAYGLWRESVRVDPNRLFWQRNAEAANEASPNEARAGPRPPSYASEDGVSYVVEAVPRSIAPASDTATSHPHPLRSSMVMPVEAAH